MFVLIVEKVIKLTGLKPPLIMYLCEDESALKSSYLIESSAHISVWGTNDEYEVRFHIYSPAAINIIDLRKDTKNEISITSLV